MHHRSLCLAVLLACCANAQDPTSQTFRARRLFGDHMVLPASASVPISGTGQPGAKVDVRGSWGATTEATIDAKAIWRCELTTPARGGPFEVTMQSGGAEIVLRDVLIGDVWLGSGQSNMVMQVGPSGTSKTGVRDWEQECAAPLPQLRLFTVARRDAAEPVDDVDGQWSVCSPATAAQFSATAYFFGRELVQRGKGPIGLVVSAWGGTVCEAWTSARGLAAFPEFESGLQALGQAPSPATRKPQPNRPTVLWNGMIAPLASFPFAGVIWYQGEANRERPEQYARLFPAMIEDWRRSFGRDLPFYFVQIAPYRYDDQDDGRTALLRQAQAAALSLPGTGMVVTLDVGDPKDIHPIHKRPVGERLAALALAKHYGAPVPCEGPRFTGAERHGAELHLRFDAGEGGLVLLPGAGGFEVAGEDGRFAAARAELQDGVLVLAAPEVGAPREVRYAWSQAPASSLKNGAGLPAAPFRASVP